MSRLSEEVDRIPGAAKIIAGLSIPVVAALFMIMGASPRGLRLPAMLLMTLIAVVFSTYVLIIGYVAADARRRGMPALLWTLLAIFIPSAIGIILYFILRRPLLRACSGCGQPADVTYTFCPSCGANLGRTCPTCHNPAESSWVHCAKCGASLRTA